MSFKSIDLSFGESLKTHNVYTLLTSLSTDFTVYIFGGLCRSFIADSITHDVDLKIVSSEEDFLSKFPEFEKKINLSNQEFYSSIYNKIKVDVTLIPSPINYDTEININNYFFNNIHYEFNSNSFVNLEQKNMAFFRNKIIDNNNFKDIDGHIDYLIDKPINFFKMLRFLSQTDFVIHDNYLNTIKENFNDLNSAFDTLNSSIKIREFYTIFNSKNPITVVSLISKLFSNINIFPKGYFLPKTVPLYINLALIEIIYDKQTYKNIISLFNLPNSLTSSSNTFLNFYFGNSSKNLSKRDKLLFNSYSLLIKKQLTQG